MQKTSRKHRKLARQVILFVAVATIAILYQLGTIVTGRTTRMYIESHQDVIRDEMKECRYLFMNSDIAGWVLDQWQKNPEPVRKAESAGGNLLLTPLFDGVTEKALEHMDPSMRDMLLKIMYRHVIRSFNDRRSSGSIDNVFVLDIRKDNGLNGGNRDGYFQILACNSDTDRSGDHGLGTYIRPEDTYSAIRAIQNGTYGQDYGDTVFQELNDRRHNKLLYVAISPVFVKGTLRYVICLEYDWSQFTYLLNTALREIALWGLAAVVVSSVLLYLLLYYRAVRPLVQVNDGVVAYMESKDSGVAVGRMAKIREKNEVGVLAENIAALAAEIDRSTEENLRLSKDRERVETELDLAAAIQTANLPTDFPQRPEILLYASMDPAKEVGGDFYDFFFIDETHLAMVIADVSGKGVPAALFMMRSKEMMKNYARMGLSPAEIMDRTNENLCANNQTGMFLTAWLGIMDLATGHITASNAGHEYPAIRKADAHFELFREQHGLALGIMKLLPYTEYEFDLEPGGTLFVYTDGVPEATDAEMQLFGTERMLAALNREPDAAPEALIENMKAAIGSFTGDEPPADDTTMLCVRRTSGRGTG